MRNHLFLLLSTVALLLLLPGEAQADQQLVFSVKSHRIRTMKSEAERKKAEKEKLKDEPIVENSQYQQTITLGHNYVIDELKGKKSIYDFAKKRVIDLNEKNKEYRITDLHALAYFRVMEFRNREFLGRVLKSASVSAPDMGDRFSIESLFAINKPGSKEKLKVEEKVESDGTRFIYKGKEKAIYVASDKAVEAPYKQSYKRALVQLFKLHPSIRLALESKNIPRELKYSYETTGVKQTLDYTLLESKEVAAKELALPADYKPVNREELEPVYQALSKLGENPKQANRADVVKKIDAAEAKDKHLEALLTLLEYSLCTGDQMTHEMGMIKDSLNEDPESRKFLVDFNPKKSKEDVEQAIKSLESIDRNKLAKSYVIDIMRANNYEALSNMGKARTLYISVLEKQPLLTGVYHDLGMNYARSYQTGKAWDCFHWAIRVFPGHKMMQEVTIMEKRLEADFPELF